MGAPDAAGSAKGEGALPLLLPLLAVSSGAFSVMAPMRERLPPAAVISCASSRVRRKLTPRFSTNYSTRAAAMPPWSMVTISLFESAGPSGTDASEGDAGRVGVVGAGRETTAGAAAAGR